MQYLDTLPQYKAWVSFSNADSASKASKEINELIVNGKNLTCSLTNDIPRNLDVYHPAEWNHSENVTVNSSTIRNPKPP